LFTTEQEKQERKKKWRGNRSPPKPEEDYDFLTRKELNEPKLNEKSDVLIESRDLDQDRRECLAARCVYRFRDNAFDDVHSASHLLSKFLNPMIPAVIPGYVALQLITRRVRPLRITRDGNRTVWCKVLDSLFHP
jgi:hypothetical protein